MDEDRPVAGFTKNSMNPLERRIGHGARGHGDHHVLESQASGGGGLVQRAGLHRIAKIEHDPAARLVECLEIRGGRLPTGHDVGEDLAGVGDVFQGLEGRRHRGGKLNHCHPERSEG